MDDVRVSQRDVTHELGTTLMAEQKDAGPIAPENGVLHGDSLNIAVCALKVEALKGYTVIVAAHEAIGNQHVLRVAWINSVIVLYPRVAKLHISDCYPLTVPRYDSPMGGASQCDTIYFNVGTVANRNQVTHRAFSPLPVRMTIRTSASFSICSKSW